MEVLVLLISFIVIALLLMPFFRKKLGWRGLKWHQGPLPKDYRAPNPWKLYIAQADEKQMWFMSIADKQSSYKAWEWFFYSWGGIGIIVCLLINPTQFDTMSLSDWATFTFVCSITLSLFGIGYLFRKKAANAPPGTYFVLDREQGIIKVPALGHRPARNYAFDDVEGYYVKSGVNQFGMQTCFLELAAFKPGTDNLIQRFILWAGPVGSYEQALLHWSQCCQYMNKSEPLPNIPQLWPTLVDQLTQERGWEGRAGREAAADVLAHAFAKEMRSLNVKEELGVESYIDPTSRDYEGPRSYDHYRRLYPTEA
jgi:hypothetical protein